MKMSSESPEVTETTQTEISIPQQQLIIPPKACKYCGKNISNEILTKDVPSQTGWLTFCGMFLCFLWFVSWIPIVNSKFCKQKVTVCPHCYRRTDRIDLF